VRTRIARWIAVLAVCGIAVGATLAYPFNNGNVVPDNASAPWIEFAMPAVSPETCDGFRTRNEAQRFFDSHQGPGHSVERLDPDNDGRACENFAFGAG
jgi:hypothetical protein